MHISKARNKNANILSNSRSWASCVCIKFNIKNIDHFSTNEKKCWLEWTEARCYMCHAVFENTQEQENKASKMYSVYFIDWISFWFFFLITSNQILILETSNIFFNFFPLLNERDLWILFLQTHMSSLA